MEGLKLEVRTEFTVEHNVERVHQVHRYHNKGDSI